MKKILQLLFMLFFNFTSAQEAEYEIMNTSVNSKFAELGATYSGNNSVIFASSKKDNSGRRTNNRQLSLELYHGLITENGDIIQTDKFSTEINNKFFESDISFTPDFKTIYFIWNNFYSTLKLKDSVKWKTLYMFKGSVNDNFEISNVTPLPFNSKEYSVRSPTVSKDGKKLYFVSDMPGGYGEFDIYVVDIHNGINFNTPKNLGPTVNSKNSELFPFIDENNTLYFSSNDRKGLGGLDIFKSDYIDGNFQQAKNLPPPINSKYDDFAFVTNIATKSGYFTSNREEGKGDVDIYAFKIKCVQTISILTFNKITEQPLEKATVSLFLNNKLIEKHTIAKNSNFKFKIDCNESYKIVAEKENFETAEITIAIDGKYNSETIKSLKLKPVECTQSLSGIILDSKTSQQIDQVVVSLFQNNNLIEKQTIGKNSNFQFNIDCNKTYKIFAEKENYESTELTVVTDGKFNAKITKKLKLKTVECVQLLSAIVLDEETNLPLSNAMVTIYRGKELLGRINLDANAAFNYKLLCDTQYLIKVSLKDYHDAITEVKTSNQYDELLNLEMKLVSSIEFVSDHDQKMIKTKTINFDLNQSTIRLDAAIELNKVIAILRKYPNLKIEIKSHTDSRAAADYNMTLSNDRAKRVIAYIVSFGIDQSRVSGRGYGETQLLNNCVKGAKCTEDEHQMNRRTEFIISDE